MVDSEYDTVDYKSLKISISAIIKNPEILRLRWNVRVCFRLLQK